MEALVPAGGIGIMCVVLPGESLAPRMSFRLRMCSQESHSIPLTLKGCGVAPSWLGDLLKIQFSLWSREKNFLLLEGRGFVDVWTEMVARGSC